VDLNSWPWWDWGGRSTNLTPRLWVCILLKSVVFISTADSCFYSTPRRTVWKVRSIILHYLLHRELRAYACWSCCGFMTVLCEINVAWIPSLAVDFDGCSRYFVTHSVIFRRLYVKNVLHSANWALPRPRSANET